MELKDRVVVITGAGHGIGAAMALRFAKAGARGIVVSDVDIESAERVAGAVDHEGSRAIPLRANAGEKADIDFLVSCAMTEYGAVDVFCSHAGVAYGGGVHADIEQWNSSWSINVLQHVYAAQAVLPTMLSKRSGYLLITASSAGLLSLPGDAAYSVTKHAAVALAEWLAITYRSRGIRVSALCPLGVRTEFLVKGMRAGHPAAAAVAAAAPLIEPMQVADAVVEGMAEERLLILPHPVAGEAYAFKAACPDEWVNRTVQGMAAITRRS